MNKCREAFEKKFPIPAHWIEFDEKRNKYYCPYVADAKAFEYQEMWEVWQSRQAELDQAYADIETFAQAHQRECDIKVQIANELKEKDKRIEEVLFVIARAKDGYYGYSNDGGDTDNLVFDFEKALGGNNANS